MLARSSCAVSPPPFVTARALLMIGCPVGSFADVRMMGICRQHWIIATFGQDLKSIHVRHDQVQQDDVWLPAPHDRQRLNSVFGAHHPIGMVTRSEHTSEEKLRFGLIVNDKDLLLFGESQAFKRCQQVFLRDGLDQVIRRP